MFENVFLERKEKKFLSISLSIVVHIICVVLVLLAPLFFTPIVSISPILVETPLEMKKMLLSGGPKPHQARPKAAPMRRSKPLTPRTTNEKSSELITPVEIPKEIAKIVDESTVSGGSQGTLEGSSSVSSGDGDSVNDGNVNDGNSGTSSGSGDKESKKDFQKEPIRISRGVIEGRIIRRVLPEYPPLARKARIEGDVVLEAIIGKDGVIHDLQVVSGHSLLVPSAKDAVSQWLYEPYVLNGEKVEVKTTIRVKFILRK